VGASVDVREETRLWRVTIDLLVPFGTELHDTGKNTESVTLVSRIPDQYREYDDLIVGVRKHEDQRRAQDVASMEGIEVVQIVCDVEGDPDPDSSLPGIAGPILTILDFMSFTMNSLLTIGQTESIDVTPPVAPGDRRTIGIYSVNPLNQLDRSIDLNPFQGRMYGALPLSDRIQDPKVAGALRWFNKSIGSQVLHDQFIFLWIALEILYDLSDIRISEPYQTPCKHILEQCPECQEPIKRVVRGSSIQVFLIGAGVESPDARLLWRMRQLLHGDIPFDSESLDGMPRLLGILRSVVASQLKTLLGIPRLDPPIVTFGGNSLRGLAMKGRREIIDSDIAPISALPSTVL
jgi:hypothetical protein